MRSGDAGLAALTNERVDHSLDLNAAEADRVAFLTAQLDLPSQLDWPRR